MKIVVNQHRRLAVLTFLIFSLSACAATLAPNFDKAIVDGLISANQKVFELFAATSAGTNKNDFYKREKTYNSLIGCFDALAIQTKARPIPKNKITEKVNEYLQSRGVATLDDEAPSATALEKISETLTKMRDTDKKQGVTKTEVVAFRGQTIIYLDQALTYESFLER